MIAILNYQAGNLKSLSNALRRQGLSVTITSDPNVLQTAELTLIPGVGAFGDAMTALRAAELLEPLRQYHLSGKPILGICLGMQLFFETSEEGSDGVVAGLGLMTGHIQRLSPEDARLKVPHMGWNQLNRSTANPLIQTDNLLKTLQIYECLNVYFVHSYGLTGAKSEHIIFTSEHGQAIPALVYKPASQGVPATGALLGFQFHPEKSGPLGEKLLVDAIQQLLKRGD